MYWYDLLSKNQRTFNLSIGMSFCFAPQVITQPAVPESRRDRIQRTAVEVARRYRVLGHDAPREGAAAFYLMLDLITFFDLCHANKLDEALDTVEKIKVSECMRGIRDNQDEAPQTRVEI